MNKIHTVFGGKSTTVCRNNSLNLFMSILVNIKNEQEEKVLVAFLNSLKYNYHTNVEIENEVGKAFLNQYNEDVDTANSEIESGTYLNQRDVEEMLKKRRQIV